MSTAKVFEWAIIGAGPAGIAAIGKLLDAGVTAQNVIWIDPQFTVGDFGGKWRAVSSNTTVSLFSKFLHACQSFDYAKWADKFSLNQLDPTKTCQLSYMVEPLQHLTQLLQQQVQWEQDFVSALALTQRCWTITLSNTVIKAKNVILAVGAEPRTLSYPKIETVHLTQALDSTQLAEACNNNDTVAVFGSSHSAVIIIRNLLENPVKKSLIFIANLCAMLLILLTGPYLMIPA